MHHLTQETKIELIPLAVRKEENRFIIGSVETNVFIKVSADVKKFLIL